MNNQKKAPNYFGIAGAVLAAMGMFMPLMELWGFQMTLVESLQSEDAGILVALILGFLALAGYLFFQGKNQGRWIGVCLLIIFLLLVFADTGGDSTLMEYVEGQVGLGHGFWVILVGLLLMVMAPNLKAWREKQASSTHGNMSSSVSTFPDSSMADRWVCPSCKRENNATDKFCVICREKRPVSLCPICGAAIRAGNVFCGNCGAKLEEAEKQEEKKQKERESVLKKEEEKRRKKDYIICPACGEKTSREKERCENCDMELAGLFKKMEETYSGVWTGNFDSNDIPRQELTIISAENGDLTFNWMRYATFNFQKQTATLISKNAARFHTTGGGDITGTIYLNGDNVIIQVESSSFSLVDEGDVYPFLSKRENK